MNQSIENSAYKAEKPLIGNFKLFSQEKSVKSKSLERKPFYSKVQYQQEKGLNKQYEELEKRLEGFYRMNIGKINVNDSGFIDYFKKLFDFLINLARSQEKYTGILNCFVMLTGQPLNIIFAEWSKLVQKIQSLTQQVEKLQEKKEKPTLEKTKIHKQILEENFLNLISENEKLKHSLKRQRQILDENRQKEQEVMKLIYAIRKKGIDIEEIYNSDVREQQEEKQKTLSSQQKSFQTRQDDSSETDEEYNDKTQDKFKLNFTHLNGIQLKGFHEEFMDKIDEFSHSWRKAALLEKKF